MEMYILADLIISHNIWFVFWLFETVVTSLKIKMPRSMILLNRLDLRLFEKFVMSGEQHQSINQLNHVVLDIFH